MNSSKSILTLFVVIALALSGCYIVLVIDENAEVFTPLPEPIIVIVPSPLPPPHPPPILPSPPPKPKPPQRPTHTGRGPIDGDNTMIDQNEHRTTMTGRGPTDSYSRDTNQSPSRETIRDQQSIPVPIQNQEQGSRVRDINAQRGGR
jgi:hypothetical protein